MINIRDIPKPIRELFLVDTLEPVNETVEGAIVRRIAYSISPYGDELKLTFHRDTLLKGEAAQLIKDYGIAKRNRKARS